jgi:hypothetical protein
MCLGFPISTTVTLQIDLNVILELIILGKYGNERDYEISMSPKKRVKKVCFIMTYRFGLGKYHRNASNRAMAVGCPLVCST